MSFIENVIGTFLRWYTRYAARDKSLPELARVLEETGEQVSERLAGAGNTTVNRRQARHVIGIERWAQRRLRVALGAPLVMDEYEGYCPPAGSDMETLRQAFEETRQQTLELASELQRAGLPAEKSVRHNDLGDLSLRGWLQYLNDHATRETLMVR